RRARASTPALGAHPRVKARTSSGSAELVRRVAVDQVERTADAPDEERLAAQSGRREEDVRIRAALGLDPDTGGSRVAGPVEEAHLVRIVEAAACEDTDDRRELATVRALLPAGRLDVEPELVARVQDGIARVAERLRPDVGADGGE